MAYIDIYAAATDDTHVLRKQIAVALHKQALVVLAEDPTTVNHEQRMAWARRVLADPSRWAALAVWRVLENGTVAGNPTGAGDALVQSVVANATDALSRAIV